MQKFRMIAMLLLLAAWNVGTSAASWTYDTEKPLITDHTGDASNTQLYTNAWWQESNGFDKMLDGDLGTQFQSNYEVTAVAHTLEIDLKAKYNAVIFTMRGTSAFDELPTNMTIEVRNNMLEDWTKVIDLVDGSNMALPGVNSQILFESPVIQAEGGFQYMRITVNASRIDLWAAGSGRRDFNISEFQVYEAIEEEEPAVLEKEYTFDPLKGLITDNTLGTSNTQLSSNAFWRESEGFGYLIDGDLATMFQSNYAETGTPHYLQVNLLKPYEHVIFTMTGTNQAYDQLPYDMDVYVTNTPEGEWTKVMTINKDIPARNSTTEFVSPVISGSEAFQYLRIVVKGSYISTYTSGRIDFNIGEFQVYEATEVEYTYDAANGLITDHTSGTSNTQLSSNAFWQEEYGYDKMFDGNTGTHFQSNYAITGTPHYLQIDLKKSLNRAIFTMTGTADTYDELPTNMDIYVTDDPEGTWTKVMNISSDIPARNSVTQFVSPVIESAKAFQYVRIVVNAGYISTYAPGRLDFNIAEFQIYEAIVKTNSAPELQAAIDEAEELIAANTVTAGLIKDASQLSTNAYWQDANSLENLIDGDWNTNFQSDYAVTDKSHTLEVNLKGVYNNIYLSMRGTTPYDEMPTNITVEVRKTLFEDWVKVADWIDGVNITLPAVNSQELFESPVITLEGGFQYLRLTMNAGRIDLWAPGSGRRDFNMVEFQAHETGAGDDPALSKSLDKGVKAAFDALKAAIEAAKPKVENRTATDEDVQTLRAAMEINEYTLTTNAKYNTYAAQWPIDFTGSALKAYAISEVQGDVVTMVEVEKVPAKTGIVIVDEAGELGSAKVTVLPIATGAAAVTENILKGVTGDTEVAATEGALVNYILAHDSEEGYGFFPVQSAGGTLAANKAYLQVPAIAAAKVIRFEGATGVKELNVETGEVKVFDLQGRRVSENAKGIVIVNGKKVLRK